MSQHRPVPGIAPTPKQASGQTFKPIQSPMMFGQPPMPQLTPEQAVAEQVQDLAMEIYCRIAAQHVMHVFDASEPDTQMLRKMAHAAQEAAKAYFEATDTM